MQRRDVLDSAPSPRDGDIFGLLDDVTKISQAGVRVRQRVEALTGLRVGELEALLAVCQGADHPRAVARSTGQVDAAATATVEVLVRRGLVGRHHHPAAPAGASDPTLLHLTEPGMVTVQQAEGIRIRVLEALGMAFGRRRTGDLRAGMQDLVVVLDADDDVQAKQVDHHPTSRSTSVEEFPLP